MNKSPTLTEFQQLNGIKFHLKEFNYTGQLSNRWIPLLFQPSRHCGPHIIWPQIQSWKPNHRNRNKESVTLIFADDQHAMLCDCVENPMLVIVVCVKPATSDNHIEFIKSSQLSNQAHSKLFCYEAQAQAPNQLVSVAKKKNCEWTHIFAI